MAKTISPLRMARAQQRKTLRDVRQVTGISIGRLSMMERGMVRPSERERHALGEALGVDATLLFP